MYNAQCDEKVVQCPFNKSHFIPSSRLQRHIVKCEKNYPADFNLMCPYNATHRLKKWEIKDHIETCPTRVVVEASQFQHLVSRDFGQPRENCKPTTRDDSWPEKSMEVPKSRLW